MMTNLKVFASLFHILLLSSVLFDSVFMNHADDLLIRRISTGLIRGKQIPVETSTGTRARTFAFFGIPYAKEPVGKLRFLPAQEPIPWNRVREAVAYGPSCIFNTSFLNDTTPIEMSENCLLVNVFTSEKCLRSGGCPVFQYIYGGQFMFGTARKLDPQIIVENFCPPDRNIVVVTFGYRMNAFGLLNLNYNFYDINPPNMAFHDILASLLWTRKEIVNFGGDPNRITLGGESSGSVATQILSVCPRANFLFHQIIPMSGPGTIEMLPKNRNQQSSRKLAFLLGCISAEQWKSHSFWANRGNVSAVLECLQKLPSEQISSVLPMLEKEDHYFHGLSTEIAPDGVVKSNFLDLLRQNPPAHPVLTGTVSKEFQDARIVLNPETGQIDGLRLWLYCRRLIRQLNYENQGDALKECFREYNDVDRVKFLFEDVNYFVPHYMFASAAANHGMPTFLYQFEYEGIGNAYGHPPDRFGTSPEWTPKHVQDLVYLFGQNKGKFTAKDRRLQRLQSALFANFIANGTPNGAEIRNAKQFRPELFNYYRIDFVDQQNWIELAGNTRGYHKRAIEFWIGKMRRIGGKAHFLSDEALIDDQMLSEFIPGDVAKFKELAEPWEELINRSAFQNQCVFLIVAFSIGLIFLSFTILLSRIVVRTRIRKEYIEMT